MFPQDLPPPVDVVHEAFEKFEREHISHLADRLKYLEANCRLLDRRARKEIKALRWCLGTVLGCTLPEPPAVLQDPTVYVARRAPATGSSSSEGGSL